jgi:ATP-binding cassette subfamily B protein
MRLHRRAEVTTAIDEAVRGIRVVKAFGREPHERGRVRTAAVAAYAIALNRVRLLARFDVLLRLVPAVFTALEIVLAGRLIEGGGFSIGKLLILLYFAQALTAFAQSFSDIADAWQAARAGATRITELLDQIPPEPPADPQPLPPVSTGLTLEAVTFHDGDRNLLTGLSLQLPPGHVVVVHGPPGSGKSLVAALAAGRAGPTAGVVQLDGSDLATLDPLEVTRAVRLLTEDPVLFGRSVRENLEMGGDAHGRSPTDAELRVALDAANASEFVDDLEHGLDTVLGDRGMTLSGGQRQRLSLARAIVRPPRVLVLDDALAAVNPALEIDIVRRLRALAPAMAILCITRREGLRTLADSIVELPDLRLPGHEAADRARAAEANGVPEAMEMALAVFGGELPPKLLQALATIPADRDEPEVTEAAATDAEHSPTVLAILRPLARAAVLAGAFLLLFTVINLVPPALYKVVTDDFNEGTHGKADVIAIAITALALLAGGANYLFRVASAKVNEGVLYLLRRRLFQRLSNLGVDYYDRELPGQVAARAVYDLDRISAFTESGVYTLTVNVTLLLAAMGVITVWSPDVATNVLPFVPALLVFSAVQVPISDRAFDRQRSALGAVAERMQEDIAGRYVIDSFGARPAAVSACHDRAAAHKRARRWSSLVGNVYIELMSSTGNLAGAALISTAGAIALRGELSVGSLVALALYLLSALGPISFLSDAHQRLLAARASFRTLRTPFGAPIRPVDRPTAGITPRLDGALALESVDFAYPGTDRTVLHDVDLRIPAGTSLALVGPTGAGKSSVAKLIARVYDASTGAVTVDGHDIRDWTIASFRTRLGIVPQDAFCFRGTLRDNLAYGRPEATTDEILAAVRAVHGDALLLTSAAGLGAPVEEEGRNLTAAQRQLVALARALLVEPDILILDEATSSLDADLEDAVLASVTALGRTTIFVTHRLPVAQQADQVALVDHGRVVEHGTHEGLMAVRGAYAGLWSLGTDLDDLAVQH